MESKLKQLEDSRHGDPPTPAPAPGQLPPTSIRTSFQDAMNVPELRYELEQLLREQKIQETVFMLMTQRYEMAKIDEARDTSSFQILDYPTMPTYPSRPRRRQIVELGFAGSLALAATWISVPIWWRGRIAVSRLRLEPGLDTTARITSISKKIRRSSISNRPSSS